MKSKSAKLTAIALSVAALFILLAAQFRIIRIGSETLFLFHDPTYIGGSGSIGHNIRASFDEAGKSSDRIKSIQYVGTNTKGGLYFACEYEEEDGTVCRYYAFDDNDLNSIERAKVLWE